MIKMKNKKTIALLFTLCVPTLTHALSFAPDTIFLTANNKSECSAMGGTFMEWYDETYCTKEDELSVFMDVNQRHAHSEAIAYVKSNGIVSGYADGTFRPNQIVNRVELLKILVEAEYRQTPEGKRAFSYTDTIPEAWYKRYVQVSSCLDIVGGYPDGSLKPDQGVSVTEASKMISNAFQFENNTKSDVWYEGFINNLAIRGALPTTIENIESALTRGQVAEIIYRLKSGKTKLATHTLTSLRLAGGTLDSSAIIPEDLDLNAELDAFMEEMGDDEMMDN